MMQDKLKIFQWSIVKKYKKCNVIFYQHKNKKNKRSQISQPKPNSVI